MTCEQTKADFEKDIEDIIDTWDQSSQGLEDQQTFLNDLKDLVDGYTGSALPNMSSWPCISR